MTSVESKGEVSSEAKVTAAPSVRVVKIVRYNRDHIFSKPFADEIDPTIMFLYKPRAISLLVAMVLAFVYLAILTDDADRVTNIKRGIYVSSASFLIIGLLQFRDGPFIRPHPAIWRIGLGIGVLYQIFLTFILFQNKSDARQFFTYLDPKLGVELPEKSYAENCSLSWDNVMSQVDIFVFAHTLGWWAKTIILRDYTFAWILSVSFEFMEYSLEHQLPNFAECWWDHWILDVLVCNWLGIYLGVKTCQYFEMKQYVWEGIRDIPAYRGKVKRTFQQFTPHSWTKFEWGATKNFRNFVGTIILCAFWLACEVNVFYLKYLLWIPAEHWLVSARLAIMFLFSVPAIREIYQYMSDKNCKRLGSHAWLQMSNLVTELLIMYKFGRGEFPQPAPMRVKVFWSGLVTALSIYAIWQFWLNPRKEVEARKNQTEQKKVKGE